MPRFSDLLGTDSLKSRMHRTIRLLHNGIRHLESAPEGDARADKAACEIALLLWGMNRSRPLAEGCGIEFRSLIDIVERRLRSEAVIQGFLWNPSRVPMLSMGTALLEKLGRKNEKFGKLSRTAWNRPFIGSSERSPFQLLELNWSSRLNGIAAPPMAPPESLLHRKPCPFFMNAEDGYAFTHTVFFETDFGGLGLPQAICAKSVWETIESGILWSLLRFDLDLLGEFLLSAIYCRMPSTPLFRIALGALLLIWDENGFVPDREIHKSDLTSSGIFYSIYHANIVSALLSCELAARSLDFETEPPSLSGIPAPNPNPCGLSGPSSIPIPKGIKEDLASSESLLGGIIGRSVSGKISEIMGSDALLAVYPEFLIGYGFVYRDIHCICQGIRKSHERACLSPIASFAVEWLAMASEMGEVLKA